MTEEKKRKILIVDDDEFLLNMYSVKFTKSGLEVITSPSGSDAIRKLKEGLVPDAIILDIVMPGMDGFELLEEIRREKLAGQAAVLVLSNQGQSSDIDRAKNLGVQGYIVKASTIPSEVLNEVIKVLKVVEQK
jgi:CheY-like chemotaxis protein